MDVHSSYSSATNEKHKGEEMKWKKKHEKKNKHLKKHNWSVPIYIAAQTTVKKKLTST